MSPAILIIEMIAHLVLIFVFLALLYVTIRRRDQIYRYIRSSRVIYWSILSICGLFALLAVLRVVFLMSVGVSTPTTMLLDLLITFLGLVAQSLVIYALIARKIILLRAVQPRRVLAIAAHPDDLELSVGATLACLKDHGHMVACLVMSHGGRGGDGDARLQEAYQSAKFLGFAHIKVLDLDDTRLDAYPNEMIRAIEDMLAQFKPDLILTHSPHEVHQDHLAVYHATLRAARSHSSILCYEGPSVTADFHPTFFIDISGYVDVKLEAVRKHRDQRGKPYLREDLIEGNLAFRGGQSKVAYAEGFEVERVLSSTIGEL